MKWGQWPARSRRSVLGGVIAWLESVWLDQTQCALRVLLKASERAAWWGWQTWV